MADDRSILDWLDRVVNPHDNESESQNPQSHSFSETDSFTSTLSPYGDYSPLSLKFKYYEFIFEIARVVNYSGYKIPDSQRQVFKAFHIFAERLLVTLDAVKENQLKEEFAKYHE